MLHHNVVLCIRPSESVKRLPANSLVIQTMNNNVRSIYINCIPPDVFFREKEKKSVMGVVHCRCAWLK